MVSRISLLIPVFLTSTLLNGAQSLRAPEAHLKVGKDPQPSVNELFLSTAVERLRVQAGYSMKGKDPLQELHRVQTMMSTQTSNVAVQNKGCAELEAIALPTREGPGAYPGQPRRIATKLIEAGYSEIAAQGLLNSLNSTTASYDESLHAAYQCFQVITGASVQNHPEKALAMFRNSPHVWDAIVAFYKKYSKSVPELLDSICIFAGLYGTFDGSEEVYPALVRSGAYDVIFDALDSTSPVTNPDKFQRALCALSDGVQSSYTAARAIANHGGHNKGIEFFTGLVEKAHPSAPYHEGNGFGLRYEILEDIIGILKHDDQNRTYARGFFDAGLMDKVLESMPDEPHDLYFQDHCCQVFNWLTNDNLVAQSKIINSPAKDLMEKAMHGQCEPGVQSCPRHYYGPPAACGFALNNLDNSFQEEWKGE